MKAVSRVSRPIPARSWWCRLDPSPPPRSPSPLGGEGRGEGVRRSWNPDSMLNFTYEQLPVRVVFGAGSFDKLAEELERLGLKRVMVLSTPGQRRLAEEAQKRLGVATAGIHAEAVMHVPVETARAGRETARRLAADCLVAIGGGSTIGLAKAVALDTGLPIIAVPTTYSGSEMTPIYGLTDSGVKRTGRDRKVLPRVVIYDPALTVGLPAKVSGPSGMNALAHCVEA